MEKPTTIEHFQVEIERALETIARRYGGESPVMEPLSPETLDGIFSARLGCDTVRPEDDIKKLTTDEFDEMIPLFLQTHPDQKLRIKFEYAFRKIYEDMEREDISVDALADVLCEAFGSKTVLPREDSRSRYPQRPDDIVLEAMNEVFFGYGLRGLEVPDDALSKRIARDYFLKLLDGRTDTRKLWYPDHLLKDRSPEDNINGAILAYSHFTGNGVHFIVREDSEEDARVLAGALIERIKESEFTRVSSAELAFSVLVSYPLVARLSSYLKDKFSIPAYDEVRTLEIYNGATKDAVISHAVRKYSINPPQPVTKSKIIIIGDC